MAQERARSSYWSASCARDSIGSPWSNQKLGVGFKSQGVKHMKGVLLNTVWGVAKEGHRQKGKGRGKERKQQIASQPLGTLASTSRGPSAPSSYRTDLNGLPSLPPPPHSHHPLQRAPSPSRTILTPPSNVKPKLLLRLLIFSPNPHPALNPLFTLITKPPDPQRPLRLSINAANFGLVLR